MVSIEADDNLFEFVETRRVFQRYFLPFFPFTTLVMFQKINPKIPIFFSTENRCARVNGCIICQWQGQLQFKQGIPLFNAGNGIKVSLKWNFSLCPGTFLFSHRNSLNPGVDMRTHRIQSKRKCYRQYLPTKIGSKAKRFRIYKQFKWTIIQCTWNRWRSGNGYWRESVQMLRIRLCFGKLCDVRLALVHGHGPTVL